MKKIDIAKVIRSKRKTFALEVTRDAQLIVRAPVNAPLDVIDRIVFKKQTWIEKQQAHARKTYRKFLPKEFVPGEGFLFLGKLCRLEIVNDGEQPLVFDGRFYLSSGYVESATDVFKAWYKEQAYRKILERVDWYAALSGVVTYKKVTITDARKRWGSCSQKGNLSFSWRLIMAPLRVVDYVVVHELAHLEEKNHSAHFWAKVATLLPDYERQLAWLKENQHLLEI